MQMIDRIGRRYGRLLVIKRAGHIGVKVAWLCRCDCGSISTVSASHLRVGGTASCGCLRMEQALRRRHGHATRSGVSPTYSSWEGLLARCRDANDIGYARYGGRGIRVCDRWSDFALFLADMGERPDGRSIDRIDTNGDYCPENCRWATKLEQANNTRANVFVVVDGESMTFAQASRQTGIPYGTLQGRVMRGRTHQEAVDKGRAS